MDKEGHAGKTLGTIPGLHSLADAVSKEVWGVRYFRLYSTGRLLYFENDKETTEKKGEIALKDCDITKPKNKRKGREHAMRINVHPDNIKMKNDKFVVAPLGAAPHDGRGKGSRMSSQMSGQSSEQATREWVEAITCMRLKAAWHVPYSPLPVPLLQLDCARLEEDIKDFSETYKGTKGQLYLEVIKHSEDRLEAATEAQAQAKDACSCPFTFLRAKELLAAKELLPLQDLRKEHPDWLEEKCLSFQDACDVGLRHTVLVVSHRWESGHNPDPSRTQLMAIQQELKENPDIEFVWFDYSCLPQESSMARKGTVRTAEEKREFDLSLSNMYLLFLSCSVLILFDLQYLCRFWTSYEAWLSMHKGQQQAQTPTPGVATHVPHSLSLRAVSGAQCPPIGMCSIPPRAGTSATAFATSTTLPKCSQRPCARCGRPRPRSRRVSNS